jgi:hypothetical protein
MMLEGKQPSLQGEHTAVLAPNPSNLPCKIKTAAEAAKPRRSTGGSRIGRTARRSSSQRRPVWYSRQMLSSSFTSSTSFRVSTARSGTMSKMAVNLSSASGSRFLLTCSYASTMRFSSAESLNGVTG